MFFAEAWLSKMDVDGGIQCKVVVEGMVLVSTKIMVNIKKMI